MDSSTLQLAIRGKENLLVEFKEKYTSKINEDMCAFANAKGGAIILGVRDHDNAVVGETLTNEMKANINSLAREVDPSVEVRIQELDGVVVIEVSEGDDKPYKCRGACFVRQDGNNERLSRDQERDFFDANASVAFESRPCRGFELSDVASSRVAAYLYEAKLPFDQPVEDVIISAGLKRGGQYTNACVLMFGNNVAQRFPHAKLLLIRFKGTTKSAPIIDRQEVTDDLLSLFNEGVGFLRKQLNLKSIIEGTERRDIYEIPIEVWREAIANAIVHRDYSLVGTDTTIEVYDDKVIIVSPGGLVKGMKKEFLGRRSVRRNELIADLFHRMNKVERAGTGVERMREFMRTAKLPPPRFETDDFFTVTLNREYTGPRTDAALSDNQERILAFLRNDSSLTVARLAEVAGMNLKTVQNNIETLKKRGVLIRKGAKKKGHWVVVDKGEINSGK